MRTLFLSLIFSFALTAAAVAKEIWIALDLSDSSPLLLEDAVAMRAGGMIAEVVRDLGRGDKVFLRSFGEAGITEQQININIRMAGQTRPANVARDLQQLIGALPDLARQGKLALEHRTNVMGWLERVGPTLDCHAEPTTVIALTDAIEWSATIQGDALLQGTPLPSPSGVILDGCAVEFWGVGQQQKNFGNDDRWYPILRATWTTYMDQAGAASFKAFAGYSR